MRSISIAAGALLVLMNTSCGGGGPGEGVSVWPTGDDISKSLQERLNSVTGDWSGFSNAPNAVLLEFKLQQGSNGQVSGTGTMREGTAATTVPITITGTFQRPLLTLNFEGIVYETRQVKGYAQGTYTSVGGVATTLTLSAPGYTRDVQILLQEK